ncbi:MAG: 2-succinyl-5-enolpyruvyl-6-hydroxy-3-cyclohexene-1-carboxylic-acid synthase [Cyclobacteriaceae bacterium]|nr:2-succinyl-5-enolpyruvyl-6-hydroxy-3-cyclohexene-1-carboxylic-acid synthase [Cyclobacteriaceae bacterium]
MNFPAIHQLAALCAAKGIEHVILCPGSRSAPLAIAFLRSNHFTCYTFSDERSAAFVGLGIAQQTGKPVVLVCTSGSAGYNFAPAVAEAYFQHIPLVVITADRPKEWIDQLDGQTIHQSHLFGDHVKRYFELPQEFPNEEAFWFANRIGNEAINLSLAGPRGPVHINAPFREPLYPSVQEKEIVSPGPRIIESISSSSQLTDVQWNELLNTINSHRKVLIVPGQLLPMHGLVPVLSTFQASHRWPIVGDILSNLHGIASHCSHADAFLGQMPEKLKHSLKPDLLITFGQSLVAKHLKLFLRKFSPRQHWHLSPDGQAADTFQSLTKVIPVDPTYFFSELNRRATEHQVAHHVYADEWMQHETQARTSIQEFFTKHPQGEFALVNQLIQSLPDGCNLHLANSMSVRYANHIGLSSRQKSISVFSNRGTSGIDGCSSTAVGHALVSRVPNVLLTGDQAFFYDRNAFWHNYPLSNLFVVVLNNHGGIIFNMIDGPSGLPEAEEYFITRQALRARSLASEFGFTYTEGMRTTWTDFFQPDGKAKIHEVESSQTLNKSNFEAFRKQIKQSYEA